MSRVSRRIDRLEVVFDDESLVADGGLLAAGTLMDRVGLEELMDEMLGVRVVNRAGFPGDSISWEIVEYGKTDDVFAGGAGACRSVGVRASGGAPLGVGGDLFDSFEVWLFV